MTDETPKLKPFTVKPAWNIFDSTGAKVIGASGNNTAMLDEDLANKFVKMGALHIEVDAFKHEEETDGLKDRIAELEAELKSATEAGNDTATDEEETSSGPATDDSGNGLAGGIEQTEVHEANGAPTGRRARSRNL